MSYEHNWGFTDPTDEYGVKVLLNDYGSGLQSTDNNDFIIEIRYCHEVKRAYQTCSGESFLIFRIISDYEPISTLMVNSRSRKYAKYIGLMISYTAFTL